MNSLKFFGAGVCIRVTGIDNWDPGMDPAVKAIKGFCISTASAAQTAQRPAATSNQRILDIRLATMNSAPYRQ